MDSQGQAGADSQDQPPPKKSRRARTQQKKWTGDEVNAILSYMKETLQKNLEIEVTFSKGSQVV
jgi:hypothetical protein